MTPATVSYSPLSPLSFLVRSADVWRDRIAVIEDDRRWTYAEHFLRVRKLVGLLRDDFDVAAGVKVATLLPNNAAALELHYGVPGAGGILVPMNTRLSASDYAYIIEHSGAALLVADATLRAVTDATLDQLGTKRPNVLFVGGDDRSGYGSRVNSSAETDLVLPDDELSLLSINYTSGTTGRPKGVMTTHRGAYLHSLGVIAEAALDTRSAYLWTLPMFHCNGWAYTWAVTASGSRHVCLPELNAATMWAAIREQGVTHMCASPTVMTMLIDAPEAGAASTPVKAFVGGSPPSPTLLARARALNLSVTHLYGLTETYGPLVVCAWNPAWDDEPADRQAQLQARQGVCTVVTERIRVVDQDMRDVPPDGATLGEVVMRGNNIMAGYYRDEATTAEAFRGGWFHSGDLAVKHPDGYMELRDRLKDIVISGGENISTIEVEQALVSHPAVGEAAVVGTPDDRWGEVPIAFLTLRGTDRPDPEELRTFLRDRLAHFKVPKRFEVVDELPKTGTGKIKKFALRDAAKASHTE